MTSSLYLSISGQTFDGVLPDQQFDENLRLFSSLPQRRSKRPKSMAGSSKIGHSSRAGGRGDGRLSASTISQAKCSSYGGGAVQALSVSISRGSSSSGSVASSAYASSNVTGYRTCLEVAGMPGKTYFYDGSSQRDRRPEYTLPPNNNVDSVKGGCRGDDKLVTYRGDQRSNLPNSSVDSDDEGDSEVTPDDSISHASFNRRKSSKSSKLPYSHRQRIENPAGLPSGPPNDYRGKCYSSSGRSSYEGEQFYDKAGRYIVVERRPRGY